MDRNPRSLAELETYNYILMNNPNGVSSETRRFYYYTQRSTAAKILVGTCDECLGPHFRISSLKEMNDKKECDWHKEEESNVFALCFSCSRTESIPMWYLYSGISGEGVRIGITAPKMQALIDSISTIYPIVDNKVDLERPLYRDRDFYLEYGWVFYLGNKKVIYNKIIYDLLPEDTDDTILEFINNNFFVKDYEWNYEKEFRIVFRIPCLPPDRIALFFDKEKLMEKGGGLSAMMAPELKNVDKRILADELGIPEKKVTKSKLNIQMNLIKRNVSSVVEHFDRILKEINDPKDLEKMKQSFEKTN